MKHLVDNILTVRSVFFPRDLFINGPGVAPITQALQRECRCTCHVCYGFFSLLVQLEKGLDLCDAISYKKISRRRLVRLSEMVFLLPVTL